MWSATQIAATALRERPVFILDGNVFQGDEDTLPGEGGSGAIPCRCLGAVAGSAKSYVVDFTCDLARREMLSG